MSRPERPPAGYTSGVESAEPPSRPWTTLRILKHAAIIFALYFGTFAFWVWVRGEQSVFYLEGAELRIRRYRYFSERDDSTAERFALRFFKPAEYCARPLNVYYRYWDPRIIRD